MGERSRTPTRSEQRLVARLVARGELRDGEFIHRVGSLRVGPHRFHQGSRGRCWSTAGVVGLFGPRTFAQGLRELEVIVTGRLIAQSESALVDIARRDHRSAAAPADAGTLIDLHARQWIDMSFVSFIEQERTDRGREWSLAYSATFRNMIDPSPCCRTYTSGCAGSPLGGRKR